ncbi:MULTISPECIES: hypothetical protein [unclassified Nocardiopsis]|uniref:hypothetical protein n=1 Tax=Nocardiopsis TaxID=2013 RepID=UPI00387B47BE
MVAVLGAPTGGADTLTSWAEAYLVAAVHGGRSAEVAAKIARHLDRFRAWMVEGFGHDRLTAVTAREVAAWRDHMAAEGIMRPGRSAASTSA